MRTTLLLLIVAGSLAAQDYSDEAKQSVRKLRVPAGLKVELYAAEPQFVNPVAMSIDDQGRVYVAETHRRHSSTLEVWDRRDWLDGDLASRTVEDRVALYRKHLGASADKLSADSERLRVLEQGRASTFAEGFNALADGLGSSVLARGSDVWYTCAPNLWHLTVGTDGKASDRKVLHTGFGVHMGSGAHDLHGLCLGPDGKLYFSMGDRGLHVVVGGKTIDNPDSGAVLRCNPDGGELELFATGLRNPEQLCFDAHGNLWTGDNNSDAGDKARWVWVVEGADYGWRFGYQREVLKSPWMLEKLWTTDAAPSQVPPAGYVGHGPSGVAFNPGTALSEPFASRFFMCDFPGSVRSFAAKPKGAGFEVVDDREFLGELWPSDCKFGPDGALYVCDWVQGWAKPEKGRIFRVFDPKNDSDSGKLLSAGMSGRGVKDLHDLLSHRDLRVRQGAQFELVARRKKDVLSSVAFGGEGISRLHGIWGLGQLGASDPLSALLSDPEAEVRAQSAKVLGELGVADGLVPLLGDESPRVRLFAALALGRTKSKSAAEPLIRMLRRNDGRDAFLHHAGVAALASIGDVPAMLKISGDASPAVRLSSLLVLRRLGSVEVKRFLHDRDWSIVLEAARAIHDVPIDGAMEDLALLLKEKELPERVAVRAVNAAHRSGRADLLLPYVQLGEGPEATRLQGLDAMADWIWPHGRDKVLGCWRPLLPRPLPEEFLAALVFLGSEGHPDVIRVHALRAWGELGLEPKRTLGATLANPATASAVRVEALRTMAKTKDPGAKAAISAALEDPDSALREEAVKLLVQLRLPETAGLLEKLALAAGALPVRQAAVASLGDWKGEEADAILSRLLDRVQDLPTGLHLEVLEAAGKRSAVEVKDRLARFERTRAPNLDLLEGGDAKVGREIFFDRLDVSCARCHTIKDKGGVVGPPLTRVGAERTKEHILESILLPNKVIAQGYGQVLLALSNESIEAGRVEKESDVEVTLLLGDGTRKRIAKSEIRARKEGLSAMPEDISKSLSRRDLRDLVAFLSSLR